MGRIHFFKASVQFLPNLKNDVGIDRLQFSPDPKDPQKGGGQQKRLRRRFIIRMVFLDPPVVSVANPLDFAELHQFIQEVRATPRPESHSTRCRLLMAGQRTPILIDRLLLFDSVAMRNNI
jgi:hypothetical protein